MARLAATAAVAIAPAFVLCMLLRPWTAAVFWPVQHFELAQKSSGWGDVGELGDGWGDVGVLNEYPNPPPFFSSDPGMLAAGDGGAWEWPYVEYGADSKGSTSGYDWEGAGQRVVQRGLAMPNTHDLYGELPPFHDMDPIGRAAPFKAYHGTQEHDEVVPLSSLPGYKHAPAAAAAKARRGQGGLVTQALASSYTDYGMSGDALHCTCDSKAAGDEEMEGLNPNVRPACTCTGGRRTVTTDTEEGGPLDTGALGAWPQGLPSDGVSYIDGGSVQAFRAFPQSLAFYPNARTEAALAGTKAGSLERGGAALKYLTRLAEEMVGEEEEGEEEQEGGEHAEVGVEGEEAEANGEQEGEEEQEGGSHKGEAPEAAEEHEEEEEEFEPTVDELLDGADGELAVMDRLLLGRMKTSLASFLEEAKACEVQDKCKDSLCACKRRVGRHLCYKLAVAWPECGNSPRKVCELPALADAHRMCRVVEKLPGVNVDSIPVMDEVAEGAVQTRPDFFVAPEGVYQ